MQLVTKFACNSIVLISSAADGEEGVPRRIAEDLATLANCSNKFLFKHQSAGSAEHFFSLIAELESKAGNGLRPILHLDMHGHPEKGLKLGRSEEFISWKFLVDGLRRVNIASRGNLTVLLTACHGIRAIMPISLESPTPFFALIAPHAEIKIWQLEEGVYPFFRSVMEEEDLDGALHRLGKDFQYFHSEKMLVVSLAKYIRQHCSGRGGKARRERLLSDVFQNPAIENNRQNRRIYRKKIRDFVKPNQALLNMYADRFLMGRKCSVTMADIERELRGLRT